MSGLSTVNDGISDATKAIQKELDKRGIINIPQGRYRITSTLKVHSGTKIIAHPSAVLFMCGDTQKQANDYLLTNSGHETGSSDIEIHGGIWDGNNQGKYNTKGDIHNLAEYSGTVLNFFNIRNLILNDMVLANSVTYNIRMARVDTFKITNISFISDNFGFNQDGLHFNGSCRNGYVSNIRALSNGQTNDDLIALNADDSMERVENIGMERGDIENILFENIYAQNCHTLVRMLSVDHSIKNITINNVYGGFRCYAINVDAARYCATPLFKEEEVPDGVGAIENISINHFTCYTKSSNPAIILESNCNRIEINDFNYITPETPALKARYLLPTHFVSDSEEFITRRKDDCVNINSFKSLKIERI